MRYFQFRLLTKMWKEPVITSSQAEVAREKTKLIQQRIKIDRILEFYQTQEAMAKAKNL